MKTHVPTTAEIEESRKWYVIDAADKVLGRLATEVASRLRGKHKAIYTPFMDTGDYIVIINAEKIRLTGNKMNNKVHYWHTGYIGGIKHRHVSDILAGDHAARVIEKAVKGMLPKNRMGRQMYRKLKVYKGSEHPHQGQNPENLDI